MIKTLHHLKTDLPASIVVFLVALPLCMGIAIASGVPPEKGLVTGIVGGILVGLLAGSPLQVSGPAAGLAVIVFDIVQSQGLAALGPIVLLAGLFQIVAGFAKVGDWFRAISPAVVHGMLTGIGVLIILAQLHVMIDRLPLPDGISNMAAIPSAFGDLVDFNPFRNTSAFMVGALTVAVMLVWDRFKPASLRLLPGALMGILAGTLLAALAGFTIKRIDLPENMLGEMTSFGDFGVAMFAQPAIWSTALMVAVIASAETLISAAAVDRMHDGERTKFNRELAAQGVGNTLCGALGALPMTGVIVRSSANVQAGATSRLSAIAHGCWLLGLVVALPGLLHLVPTAALAGVLVVTGWRLVNLGQGRQLLERYGWLPAAAWAATLITVVAVDLLAGVLAGLALTALQVLPHARRRLVVRTTRKDSETVEINLAGNATFVRLPHLSRALEQVPDGSSVHVKAGRLDYLDHTCAEMVSAWADRLRAQGGSVGFSGRTMSRRKKLDDVMV
jgi:MFS superfamily sulfate permease-like transporter